MVTATPLLLWFIPLFIIEDQSKFQLEVSECEAAFYLPSVSSWPSWILSAARMRTPAPPETPTGEELSKSVLGASILVLVDYSNTRPQLRRLPHYRKLFLTFCRPRLRCWQIWCPVKTCFLFLRGAIMLCLHMAEGQGSPWDFFYKDMKSIYMHYQQPKAPQWDLGFQHTDFGSKQTSQSQQHFSYVCPNGLPSHPLNTCPTTVLPISVSAALSVSWPRSKNLELPNSFLSPMSNLSASLVHSAFKTDLWSTSVCHHLLRLPPGGETTLIPQLDSLNNLLNQPPFSCAVSLKIRS